MYCSTYSTCFCNLILENVIAMSFPSSGKYKLYRNPISVSYLFLLLSKARNQSTTSITNNYFSCCRRLRDFLKQNILGTTRYITCAVSLGVAVGY